MIDVKPPEEVTLNNDLSDFKEFLSSHGINYSQAGDELEIDSHDANAKEVILIKFFEDGSFAEFDYIGSEVLNTHYIREISKTLKDILREMRKRK